MILFGAGYLGRAVNRELTKIGVQVDAFADNNFRLWGTYIDSVPVIPPHRLVDLKHQRVAITIYNRFEVKQQLRELKIPDVVNTPYLMRDYPQLVDQIPYPAMEEPSFYAYNQPSIEKLDRLLADDESREVLRQQIAWRTTFDDSVLDPHLPISDIYFPNFIEKHRKEIFVDCGAYDGDTIRAFQSWSEQWRMCIGFEPIAKVNADAYVFPCAVSDTCGMAEFDERGVLSTFGQGKEILKVTLDNTLENLKPTFIKMDVEGSELYALQGSRIILRDYSPVLAVCLYHRPDHLWRIPLLIHSIQPGYNLYIRRYADECWELVCYAVPKWRVRR